MIKPVKAASQETRAHPLFDSPYLKPLSLCALSVCLLVIVMAAFVVIPKVNQVLEKQHQQAIELEAAREVALVTRFINSQRNLLRDLAKHPSIASSVLVPKSARGAASDLLENTVTAGQKGRYVLQDLAGNILLATASHLQARYSKNETWLRLLLEGSKDYHFQLLSQSNELFTFKISVPVYYDSYIEGVLSSEVTLPIQDIFTTQLDNSATAFKLTQDDVQIATSTQHIKVINEQTLRLPDSQIIISYITDDRLIKERKRELRDTTLTVLLISFICAFAVFLLLVYRRFRRSHQPTNMRPASWRTYIVPISLALIGFIASVLAYIITLNVENTATEEAQLFASKQKVTAIREKISSNLNILGVAKAFYDASNYVSLNEFQLYAKQILASHRHVQAIEWIARVEAPQREVFEKQLSDTYLTHSFLKQRNEAGELILAKQRSEYFPVYYVEPYAGNEAVVGFDVGSNARVLASLKRAWQNQVQAASSHVTLIQKDAAELGVLVFDPVFEQPNETNLQSALKGFVLLVWRVEDMLKQSETVSQDGLLLYVEDISDPNNVDVLYGKADDASTFVYEEIVDVAGKRWRIVLCTNDPLPWLVWNAVLVLISGMVFTVLTAFGIAYLIRRRELVEQLVNKKTIELINSEEKYRAIVENAADALLTIDQDGTIEAFNQAAQVMFGYTQKQVLGRNIKTLIPANYHQQYDDHVREYRQLGSNKDGGLGYHMEGLKADASLFPIDFSLSEMRFATNSKYSVTLRDISQRITLERERESFIESLTDSNEELERFAYVCSHDLQEPLRMVSSFSEKLQMHLADRLEGDEKGKKYFYFIIDGALRAQTLIADILTYSSISNDTQMLERVNIEEIIKSLAQLSEDSDIYQKASITFDPLPQIHGNKAQLLQLFQNVVNNGIKYQKAGAKPHVHISAIDKGEHWMFMVKDNGIGMKQSHLKKIFEVFQRLHRRNEYAGTGIGLSICKKVAERHGGAIWVESEKDLGSTFYIKLLKPRD